MTCHECPFLGPRPACCSCRCSDVLTGSYGPSHMIEFCCSVNTWLLSLKYGRLDASFTASMRRISEIQIPAFRLFKLQTCISRYHLAHILLICNSSHFPHLVQHKVKKQPDSIHLPRTQYSSVQNNTKILGDARSGEHEEGDGHHRHALHPVSYTHLTLPTICSV